MYYHPPCGRSDCSESLRNRCCERGRLPVLHVVKGEPSAGIESLERRRTVDRTALGGHDRDEFALALSPSPVVVGECCLDVGGAVGDGICHHPRVFDTECGSQTVTGNRPSGGRPDENSPVGGALRRTYLWRPTVLEVLLVEGCERSVALEQSTEPAVEISDRQRSTRFDLGGRDEPQTVSVGDWLDSTGGGCCPESKSDDI